MLNKNDVLPKNGTIAVKTKDSVLSPPYSVPYLVSDNPAEFPQTVFIDQLTITDDENKEIPGAKERVAAMRAMRFFPNTLYKDKTTVNEEKSPYNTINGVRFLKPMENPNNLNFNSFTNSNVTVIESRGFWHSVVRGFGMLLSFLSVLFAPRLFAKATLIEPGWFGYAKDINGNIEIYPSSTEYRVPLSFATNIKKTPINTPYVNIENRLHLVNVPEGKYAVATRDRHPVILPAGRHLIESVDFQLRTVKTNDSDKAATDTPVFYDKNSNIISHGDSHIIRVPKGHVGFGHLRGEIVILEPEHNEYDKKHGTGFGAYVFHDPDFKLGSIMKKQEKRKSDGTLVYTATNPPASVYDMVDEHFQSTGDALVSMGPVRVLTVPQTHAAVTRNNGKIEIYHTGRHALVNAQHEYKDPQFDLTQQKIDVTHEGKDDIFVSADGVQLRIKAELLFVVSDVQQCMQKVGITDYKENIRSRTMHILRELIKASNYLNPQELNLSHGNSSDGGQQLQPYDASTAEKQQMKGLGVTLRNRLQQQLNLESGIELHDVLITGLIPNSKDLLTNIESQATTIAKAQRDITEAEMQQNIQKTTAETTAATSRIKAENDAKLLEISTGAEAKAKIVAAKGDAEAEAEKTRITNEANYVVIKRTAESKAEATLAEAEADKKANELRAQGLSAYKDGFPQQMQLLGQAGVNTKGLLEGAKVNLIASSMQEAGAQVMFSQAAGLLFGGRDSNASTVNAKTAGNNSNNV